MEPGLGQSICSGWHNKEARLWGDLKKFRKKRSEGEFILVQQQLLNPCIASLTKHIFHELWRHRTFCITPLVIQPLSSFRDTWGLLRSATAAAARSAPYGYALGMALLWSFELLGLFCLSGLSEVEEDWKRARAGHHQAIRYSWVSWAGTKTIITQNLPLQGHFYLGNRQTLRMGLSDVPMPLERQSTRISQRRAWDVPPLSLFLWVHTILIHLLYI